jgi:hypothetical protein
VDFDTWDGRAACFFTSPRELELAELDGAADDAGYETVGMRLQVSGRTERARCATCEDEATFLVVPETGQRFELAGALEPGLSLRVSGSVLDWKGEHPQVAVEGTD